MVWSLNPFTRSGSGSILDDSAPSARYKDKDISQKAAIYASHSVGASVGTSLGSSIGYALGGDVGQVFGESFGNLVGINGFGTVAETVVSKDNWTEKQSVKSRPSSGRSL